MKKCFVAMGFGEKTAFYLGKKKPRVLDLDKTYKYIIQPGVTAAGLECVRADEIQHSTMIDKPMYEHLLSADVVVADISTSNANAIYELGVRHALKPWTTIVMAEKEFTFPFDITHLSILRYEHLGKDIGAGEAQRVTKALTEKLQAVLAKLEVDSPVFLFLPQLQAERAGAPAAGDDAVRSTSMDNQAKSEGPAGPSLAELRGAFEQAKAAAKTPQDWRIVAARLEDWRRLEPGDPFLIQQLALATYKSGYPDKIGALEAAARVLEALQPKVSSDAETVGLWGAIHKRLWDARRSRVDLDEAIRSYGRGFLLKNDYYNGINLAFLYDLRASESGGDEAVADSVMAARARREVVAICDRELDAVKHDATQLDLEELYWLRASRVEALLGLGDHEGSAKAFEEARSAQPAPEPWMIESTEEQLKKLEGLLAKRRGP